MHFNPSYFNGEERDGFYIAPMMKRVWAAQLEVLHQIDIICKRHNIMYFADWGTLLGAVRHQGFIPWDDDIDIGMLRKDYVRFLHYAKKELPERYQIINIHNTSQHTQLITRVNNSNSIKIDSGFLTQYHGCPYVVGVDLFVTDYLPLDKDEEATQLSLIISPFLLHREWDNQDLTMEEKLQSLHEIEEMCNITFTKDKPIKQQLLILCDQLCAMYWDTDATEVSFMLKLCEIPHYRLPISCYESTIEVPFETTTIPIPIGYEQILKLQYGDDYMTPKHINSSHEYPFYNKQKPDLEKHFEKYGLPLPTLFQE